MKEIRVFVCENCGEEVEHDFETEINDSVKSYISVCKECGYADIQHEPIEPIDIDLECFY
jgi:uncharacterized Zn finger protein